MSNPVDTYENHLKDVEAMHQRMRHYWWDKLRADRRVRKCSCGKFLIRLIGLKKNRKKLHKYYWCDLGMGERDARPWAYYFRLGKHKEHRCGGSG